MSRTPEAAKSTRSSWVGMVLVLGHLALIAMLGLLALTDRPGRAPSVSSGPSILESLKADVRAEESSLR